MVQRVRPLYWMVVLWAALALAGCGGSKTSPELSATGVANLAETTLLGVNNAQRGINQGQLAPDFTLRFADGSTNNLSDWQGKPVVLNFWATWCPPCREEMPGFVEAYKRHGQDMVVVAVNAQESAAEAAAFMASHDMAFPVALDSRGEIQQLYNVRGLPTTVFLDREGRVAGQWQGLLPYAQLEEMIADLQ